MQIRAFGNTDLRVSALGLGCARLGGVFKGDSSSFGRLLAVARDAGITFFDTADMYSQGESESVLGRAFGAHSGRRAEVVIATKAGYRLPGRRQLAGRLKPLLRPVIRALGIRREQLPARARGNLAQDFSGPYLVKALDASLRRLRTDYVDLLQLHSPDASVIERGDWQSTLDDLKRSGKIRYYGIACDSVSAGLAALRFPGLSSLQFTFSLLEQAALERLLPDARAQGVAVIARECLGHGLLVKQPEDIDLAAYCSSPEEVARRTQQLQALRARAAERKVSLAQTALEFASNADGVSVALVGASRPEQLRRLLDELPL